MNLAFILLWVAGALGCSLPARAAENRPASSLRVCMNGVLGHEIQLNGEHTASERIHNERKLVIVLCKSEDRFMVVENRTDGMAPVSRALYTFPTSIEPATKLLIKLNAGKSEFGALSIRYEDMGGSEGPSESLVIFDLGGVGNVVNIDSWAPITFESTGSGTSLVVWKNDFGFEPGVGVYLPHRLQLSKDGVFEAPVTNAELSALQTRIRNSIARMRKPNCDVRVGSQAACDRLDELIALDVLVRRLIFDITKPN